MTTREKAHALLDELTDEDVKELIGLMEIRQEEQAEPEPEMAELPDAWKTFEDGTPVPNWVAMVREGRRGH
jgi:hypothetical protein